MLLVLDIGGTQIKYATMENGSILKQGEQPTSIIHSKESFFQTIIQLSKDLGPVEGIAISMPGIIDSIQGKIEIVSVFPYLNGVNICKELSELTSLKVTVENDAKSAALCEARIGNAKDAKDAVVLVFGTGIGGSLIKDHMIHHGCHLLSGEVSTIIIDDQGTEWSDVCSTSRLCKAVAAKKGLEKINGKEVYQLVKNGDQQVIEIINLFYHRIAIQLYNFQYIFDPDIILLGGGISKEPLFKEGIQQAINNIQEGKLVIPRIDTCKFYNDANLYGAYYHYLDQQ